MNALNGCPYIRLSSWLSSPVHLHRFCVQGVIESMIKFDILNDVNRTNLSGMAFGETTNPRITDNTQFYTDLSTTAVGAEEVREIYGSLLNENKRRIPMKAFNKGYSDRNCTVATALQRQQSSEQ